MLGRNGKERQAKQLVQVRCRQSLVLCQLEKTHIEKQLHKLPNAIVPGTLLHTKYCNSMQVLQHLI